MEVMKTCNTCGKEKVRNEFSKRKAAKDGLNPTCKECVKVRSAVRAKAKKQADILTHAKKTAALLNLPFDITDSDLKIPDTCPYIGVGLTSGKSKGDDRVEPAVAMKDRTKGFVSGNVEVTSKTMAALLNTGAPEVVDLFMKALKKRK